MCAVRAQGRIAALDQGTTSSRAVVFDSETVKIECIKNHQLTQYYPHPAWVEQDPQEIWRTQLDSLTEACESAGLPLQSIACLGITNQRETVVVWDKKTGKPVYNAIVWQCRRSAGICRQLMENGYEDVIREKTGLIIDAYFSGTKIKWILDNVPGARERAKKGELLAGTVDSWLVWKLTGGAVHITDYTNASRTLLFNINTLDWDDELLAMLDIPRCMLPSLVQSSGFIAETSQEVLGARIPICGIAGDQQAALFGQACFEPGSVKNTYGTGCFILMNTGDKPVVSKNRLLSTIAWVIGGKAEYALEGSVFNAGSAIQWLRDELRLIGSAPESDALAETVPDTGGVYVVPAFTGLGAPYWDMYARGTITGLTRGTRKEHFVRAVLEAIAYQSRDVMEAMEADSGIRIKELKVDGGASVSRFLMQFQADMMNVAVKKPEITETTAMGAAFLAGMGAGIWSGQDEIAAKWKLSREYSPSMDASIREGLYESWKRAVERSLGWERV
ncbi:MAG: glycerol kinase GlpK [Clostridiaceae bacterium]|jgi:glycerol kinase|nr:glycerol kinase GlpK [Clostridiaceae bacterium]